MAQNPKWSEKKVKDFVDQLVRFKPFERHEAARCLSFLFRFGLVLVVHVLFEHHNCNCAPHLIILSVLQIGTRIISYSAGKFFYVLQPPSCSVLVTTTILLCSCYNHHPALFLQPPSCSVSDNTAGQPSRQQSCRQITHSSR